MSLAGVRVALTASRDRSEAISFLLEDEGAEVQHLPLLELAPPADPRPFAATVEHLSRYPKMLLSSLEAVVAVWEGARIAGTTRALGAVGFIVTDPAITRLLAALGQAPWLDLSGGAALALEPDTEVLVPLGAGDTGWPQRLAEAGARPIPVVAWQPRALAWPEVAPQLILFSAPGPASALHDAQPAWLEDAVRVAGSPATADELQRLGRPAHTVAEAGSLQLLDAALAAWKR